VLERKCWAPGHAEGSGPHIEEGSEASKSLHKTLGYFLSTSHQEVSADNIQNSAVGNFSLRTEGTKTKSARCIFFSDVFSLPVHF
jgi:hypothetical protein